jgi:hypothetical protein
MCAHPPYTHTMYTYLFQQCTHSGSKDLQHQLPLLYEQRLSVHGCGVQAQVLVHHSTQHPTHASVCMQLLALVLRGFSDKGPVCRQHH